MQTELLHRQEHAGGSVLSSAKKTAGTKGKRNLPRAGGETEAVPLQMDALCSPNTDSWWGFPVLLTVPLLRRGFSPHPIHCFPRDAADPERPVGAIPAAAAREAGSQLETVNSSSQPPHHDG